MDDENEFEISKEEYDLLLQKCEYMLESKVETYFDVHEYIELLDSFLEQGKLNKAYSILTIAQKQHIGNLELEFRKARIHIERNDSETAIAILKRLLKVEPKNADLHVCLGVAYIQIYEYSDAISCFTIANTISPEDEEDNLYHLAVSFLNNNEYELASTFLEDAHERYPRNLLMMYDLAFCYERMEKYDMSISLYQKYIKADPYSEQAWYNLGLLYVRIEKYTEAISAFEYALAIDDSFILAYSNKAFCYVMLQNYEQAIESYKEVLKIEDSNALVLLNIAECYEKILDLENAEICYNKIVELEPEFSDGWYGLGSIALYTANFSLAKKYIAHALELDSENYIYILRYAVILKELQEYDLAIEACKKAILLEPTDLQIWIEYSQIEFDLGHFEIAKSLLLQGYTHTEHAALYYIYAAILAHENSYDEAIEYFTKAYAVDETLSDYFFDFCYIPSDKLSLFHTVIHKQ